ncbi:MAG: hypothetical protein QGI35_01040 [Arenicellales bacterium]|nr:hypothetical protein [Arenicellales bacterium]MDP6391539.1 hypothetical protein [Arenicellales bacterium]MDP7221388.1 hypothetical protein [Arenicellales bacterium]HJP09240.1 hypothetical protein [Arenicellales bacterium]
MSADPPIATVDVVVIGAGVMSAGIALQLSRRSAEWVMVVDVCA